MNGNIPLGKPTTYQDTYDRSLLVAIARDESRRRLGLQEVLPFEGCDLWNAWDLTWLNPRGVPQVAAAEMRVPCDSPALIESKSLKLYLNSFSMSRFHTADEVTRTISGDLSASSGGAVEVRLLLSGADFATKTLAGSCIDSSDIECNTYTVDADLLSAGKVVVREELHSHVLRSLCPVTGQPDLGSVLISYTGPQLNRAALLRYIVSYRKHQDFHEGCVERMFIDIHERCKPTDLTVYARYQRRGGIDINPFRSNVAGMAPSHNLRTWRQ